MRHKVKAGLNSTCRNLGRVAPFGNITDFFEWIIVMYRLFFVVFGALCLLTTLAFAEGAPCAGWGRCPAYQYSFLSTYADRSYGVLVTAPEKMPCSMVRFLVRRPGAGRLGLSEPLTSGQLAVLRVGRGFAPGNHHLMIEAVGCAMHPGIARPVLLNRASPDHSWRAGLILSGG